MDHSPDEARRRALTLAEALALAPADTSRLFARHVNPGLASAYRWLGTDTLAIESAHGAEIRLRDGRTLLDASSSFGVTPLGHGAIEVLRAQDQFRASGLPDAFKVGPHPLAAALAASLARVLPAPLEVSYFATSGAEAVEAALKLALRLRGGGGRRFIATSGAFHGKSIGSLALTSSGTFREGFLLGIPRENIVEVPYGDRAALERALDAERERGGAIAFVFESLQGQAVIAPPKGYISASIDLCRRAGVISIADEVKVGLGRTGRLLALDDERCVPDVLTLAKGLGGGRHAIGVMVTSRELFERAYGGRKACALHTTTFGGLGEACAVALEVLHRVSDPAFLERVRAISARLDAGLRAVQAAHPRLVADVRGVGLFRGLELALDVGVLAQLRPLVPDEMARTGKALFTAALVRALVVDEGVLTHFCDSDPEVLHLMPPLVVDEAQIDRLVAALNSVLARGIVQTITAFAAAGLRPRT